jgi:protoporphyrinogen IX oxidase
MTEFLQTNYTWLTAFHIIALISWMAGMLYLPRLYVYHAGAAKGSELSETLKTMERRLLRYIMNPAMIATFIFGLAMLAANPSIMVGAGWMHAKLLLVLLMAGAHGFYAVCRKGFERDDNTHTANFYRVWNEIPTVLMIIIVILVIVKPF